ncbi:hypothetical protein GHT09_002321 [Marmota monax]|uniref:Uncharacterized protein n=1 Tax=Marmota monax TaxID=9995 RepID=A0A834R1N4_MARMO|nr:hypothetical protein GHT09_002321 [Marmota monax]
MLLLVHSGKGLESARAQGVRVLSGLGVSGGGGLRPCPKYSWGTGARAVGQETCATEMPSCHTDTEPLSQAALGSGARMASAVPGSMGSGEVHTTLQMDSHVLPGEAQDASQEGQLLGKGTQSGKGNCSCLVLAVSPPLCLPLLSLGPGTKAPEHGSLPEWPLVCGSAAGSPQEAPGSTLRSSRCSCRSCSQVRLLLCPTKQAFDLVFEDLPDAHKVDILQSCRREPLSS